ncbi:MAG: DNA polymerase I, partial [Desulfobulbia bacterium]
LINEYGDLDSLLQQAENIKQKKRRENLIEFADLARISRQLVTLEQDVPLKAEIETTAVVPPVPDELLHFMTEMEFNTLTRRISEALGVEAPKPLAKSVGSSVRGGKSSKDGSASGQGTGDATPGGLAAIRHSEAMQIPVDRSKYETLTTVESLREWISEANSLGYVAFDTETTSLDAMQADLAGFSMATRPGRACYVPVGHNPTDGLDFGDNETVEQIPVKQAIDELKPLLEDPAVLKIGQNLKYDGLLLRRYGVDLTAIDDTMLISYVLDGGKGGHGMDDLAQTHLGHICIKFKDIAGSGKSQLTFDRIAIDKASEYAAEDADITLRLWSVLKPRLAAESMTTVYETLERPLVKIITDMEQAGIKVQRDVLSRLSGSFAQTMGGLEAEIHKLAGESFNIASPKQLGEILFDKMGIAGGKKTKTGAWGTGADVLEELAAEGHDLPKLVLEWRGLAKLKSTYTDALPSFINPTTGRIHTSYAMAATTTGRLASTDPNLQNIPVRTAEGRQIRTAFVAEKGSRLLSADYSQIELRVLAHIADIDNLKQAFADGLDIHAMTASEMFGVPIEGMDPGVRRRAKAINFGIIYGISAFGLANQLGISRGEAAEYIKTYFERFPGIRDYMEAIKKVVHQQGYVTTIFGRKVHYPEINTKNPQRRSFYERAAINAPIQGSAADIIRRAMVRLPNALAVEGLTARMLLQVHDELIFEVK